MKNEELTSPANGAAPVNSSFFIPCFLLKKLALLAGLAVTAVRLSLVGTGALAFVDEQRYVTAMLGLRALGQGHGLGFLQAINSMGARPGDGLWRALPGMGQAALLLVFGLNPNAPPSLQVPQVFNVLIISLNALLLYRIYRQVLGSGPFALLSVALYSSLANTNFYLRHLLPYDHALFFFLLALWLLLAGGNSARRAVLVGALAGFSYAVYPGYFLGPAVLLALSALRARTALSNAESFWGRFGPVLGQVAGLLAVLGALEILAQAAGTSYFASSRYIATTVTQGSFDEGFSFIGRYFWQVEGRVGVGLLTLGGAGLLLSLRRRPTDLPAGAPPRAARPLLGVVALAWLGYACVVQFAHGLVFYGRTLHFFVPFVVLGAAVAVQEAARRWPRARTLLLAGGGAVALGQFGAFVAAYRAVAYPADVAYAHGITDARQIAASATTGCDRNVVAYRPFGPRMRGQSTAGGPRYRLVNFAYLYPLGCYAPPRPDAHQVVAAVPYFMKYAPYQFEGHDPAQRARLQRYRYEFRISRAD